MIRTTLSIVSGLVVGFACGWACQHWLGKRPLLQSVAAMVLASVLASILPAVLWLLYPPADADIAAVAFGFADAAITTAGVAIIAAVLHFGSEWSMGASPLLAWRPVILGTLAGTYSAAATAWEMGALRPMH